MDSRAFYELAWVAPPPQDCVKALCAWWRLIHTWHSIVKIPRCERILGQKHLCQFVNLPIGVAGEAVSSLPLQLQWDQLRGSILALFNSSEAGRATYHL